MLLLPLVRLRRIRKEGCWSLLVLMVAHWFEPPCLENRVQRKRRPLCPPSMLCGTILLTGIELVAKIMELPGLNGSWTIEVEAVTREVGRLNTSWFIWRMSWNALFISAVRSGRSRVVDNEWDLDICAPSIHRAMSLYPLPPVPKWDGVSCLSSRLV